jgi:uncharacterized membrane protein
MHILGDHAALIVYPLSLIYWVASDVRLLLTLQSTIIALGAIPIYWLGKMHGKPLIGIWVAAIYLLHPATLNMNLFDFHTDALAGTALLFAIWSAESRRWWLLFICCAIVLACKENFALTVVALGGWLILQRQWSRGVALCILSIGWFFITTQYLSPSFNGLGRSFHLQRYTQYGSSSFDIMRTLLLNPVIFLREITQPAHLEYILKLCIPFAFVCFLSLRRFMIAMPALLLNILSPFPPQTSLPFHYNTLLLAAIAIASLSSLVHLAKLLPKKHLSIGLVMAFMVGGLLYVYKTVPLSFSHVPDAARTNRVHYYDYLISVIPPDASVSSPNTIQPHLAHRVQSYLFPNPFQDTGLVNPKGMPYSPHVEYILYDTKWPESLFIPAAIQLQILRGLQARGEYTVVADLDGAVLLKHKESETGVRREY